MAAIKPSSSESAKENAKELKKLQREIKLMNRNFRLKVNKAYMYKIGNRIHAYTWPSSEVTPHINITPRIPR